MARYPLRIGFVALLLVVIGLASTSAAAADLQLRLELDVPDDQAPTHVCVVTSSPTKGTKDGTALSKLPNVCVFGGPPEESCGLKWKDGDWQHSDLYLRTPTEVDPVPAMSGLYEDQNEHQCKYGEMGCKPLFSLRGFDDLDQSYITCVENVANPKRGDRGTAPAGQGGPHVNRGLLLGLSVLHEGEQGPLLRGLRLDGRQLSVTIDYVKDLGHVARVLGGYYAPLGEVFLSSGVHEGKLAIEPRCRWTTLKLPPIATRIEEAPVTSEAAATASIQKPNKLGLKVILKQDPKGPDAAEVADSQENQSIDACVSGSVEDGTLRLLVPYAPRGKKVLTIQPEASDQLPGAKSTPPRWALQANWFDPRPVEPNGRLSMSLSKLSFTWRVDRCLYPQGLCPKAAISTSGVDCDQGSKGEIDPEGLCHYTCENGSERIDFPNRIAFSFDPAQRKQQGDEARASEPSPATSTAGSDVGKASNDDHHEAYMRWSIPITTIDQTVEGYVDPRERSFEVVVEKENPYGRRWRQRTAASETPPTTYPAAATTPATTDATTKDTAATPDPDPPPSTKGELRKAFCPAPLHYDDIHAIEFWVGPGVTQRVEIHELLDCHDEGALEPSAKKREHVHVDDDESAPPLVVRLPNLSCSEPVRFRYVGERPYEPRFERVESGKIALPHPMATARRLHYAIGLYPVSFPVILPRDLGLGRVTWAPLVEGSLVWKGYHERTRGWRFNADVGAMVSRASFRSIEHEVGARLYTRWLVGASFLSPWIRTPTGLHEQPVGVAPAFGFGAQLVLGHPLRRADFDVFAFERPSVGLALHADVRVRIWRFIEVSFSPRVVLDGRPITYSTDYSGQPKREIGRWPLASLSFPVGLVFIW